MGLILVATVSAAALAVVGRRPHAGQGGGTSSAPALPDGRSVDAGRFAAGSCMAFPPTSGSRNATVFLDAGHGGIDPGAIGVTRGGKTIYEASETLAVEFATMALLRADGFRVVVSRTGNATVLRLGPADISGQLLTSQGVHDEVAARDVCANEAKARVLVGIYYNAGGSSQDAGGLTAYDAARPFSSANLALATLVQHDVLDSLNKHGWGIPNDGVVPDPGLGSLSGDPGAGGSAAAAAAYGHLLLIGPAMAGFFTTPSTMPGVVTEPLYLTDPFEGSVADSTSGQAAIAHGIALAVERFLASPRGAKASSALPRPLVPPGG